MPKKLVKKIVKQTFELPGEIGRKAGEEVGLIPRKEEEEPKLAGEELEKKAEEKKAAGQREIDRLEAEIAELVKKRQEEKVVREEVVEEKEPKKPLVQPEPKRPRKFLAGLKRRWEKFRPELAGRRTGG